MAEKGSARQLSDRQRVAWLRLIRTPHVGPATFRELIARYGSAEAAIEALPELMRRGGGRTGRIPSAGEAEDELQRAAKLGARFVAVGERDYPGPLARIEYAPPLLAVKGSAQPFAAPMVAIVGARNASLSGMKFARQLAADLGRQGFVVVSGLARGIDTAAHRGSLDTGTVAAVAGGIDKPYPPENAGLIEDIAAAGGAVVSEMPLGWEPRAQDFPRRNRLIAGMALGLVVVEAARRSGSLISARLAGEMGRLVFAVPGSPLDPRTEGTNRLLKDGALLVTEAQDVVDHIVPMTGQGGTKTSLPLAEPTLSVSLGRTEPDGQDEKPAMPAQGERERFVELLGPSPAAVDDLIRHADIATSAAHLILLELDLAGRLERHAGGKVSLLA